MISQFIPKDDHVFFDHFLQSIPNSIPNVSKVGDVEIIISMKSSIFRSTEGGHPPGLDAAADLPSGIAEEDPAEAEGPGFGWFISQKWVI